MRKALLLTCLLSSAALSHAPTTGGAATEYRPQGSIRDYFLGAWKLVATEIGHSDGRTTPYPELGPNAVGFLLYSPSGHMCAQLMKPARPRWADEARPTAAEAASALDGFSSYCGTFEVRESERTMVHHPETAWNPAWVGSTQLRPFHLVNQNRFFFRGQEQADAKDGTRRATTWTVTWERLPAR